ncbi:hypothetical protein ACWEN3_31965 [Streptomyces sp. NPDC004561]
MSSEREYGAAANGAQGAGEEPGAPPVVYHPRPAQAPAYEEYTDPAAAHGWQNAYDETRELPRLADPGEGRELPPPADPGEGRAERRRREQRRRGGRRRLAAVAGALGVAGTVALIAGVTDSGSPAGSRPTQDGRADATESSRTDSAPSTATAPATPDAAAVSASAAPSTSLPAAPPTRAPPRPPPGAPPPPPPPRPAASWP